MAELRRESSWHRAPFAVWWLPMGHNKGKDNVKKRKARRTKDERLQTAKDAAKASK